MQKKAENENTSRTLLQGFSTARKSVEMYIYVSSITLHRNQPQITAEISRILRQMNRILNIYGCTRTRRDKGNPYPKPAMGALKSLPWVSKSWSTL